MAYFNVIFIMCHVIKTLEFLFYRMGTFKVSYQHVIIKPRKTKTDI